MFLKIKKALISIVTTSMVLSCMSLNVFADSSKILTLGADLSESQKQTVLDFFGITDTSDMEVITVNNQEERETLNGLVSTSVIGTHTYSCAYIQPTTSGGINVKTANLTYVTCNTLTNALETAGIENCDLIVTAPFAVSGTGALTGVYKAFAAEGITLDEDKKDLATEELVTTAELENNYGEDATDMVTDLKEEVASSDDLSDEELTSLIKEYADKYGITLTDSEISKLLSILQKVQDIGYSKSDFENAKDQASGILGTIFDGIKNFGKAIIETISNFISSIISDKKDDTSTSGDATSGDTTSTDDTSSDSGSIFDNVNQDVYEYDETSED